MKFALAGNPNCGKTTLFNSLTGATAHVGNWPGVTVDKREGQYRKLEEKVDIVDLPGIYSLSPYTPEEIISRNYILDEKPDCVINVVDATNLERNLYLTTQLLEIKVPVVVCLNMMDLVKTSGRQIKSDELEKVLGVKVVEISALKSEGLENLMRISYEEAKKEREAKSVLVDFPFYKVVEQVEEELETKMVNNPLFHAIKLLENDQVEVESHPEVVKGVAQLKEKYEDKEFDGDFEAIVADARYRYITKNFAGSIVKAENEKVITKSDKIDKVLTHRIWSIPIFLVIIFLVFHIVFSEDLFFLNAIFGLEINNEAVINFFTGMGASFDEVTNELIPLAGLPSPGVFLQSWMGFLTGGLKDLFNGFMPEGTWYTGFVVDGLLTGLDSIFSFLPQILLLFLFISILEDSGYMARVAFIMDRAFRKFGLSGKSFIPLFMGFGCSVPAMIAARTLENEKERDMTIRLTPFFSCGAKAPIWAMLAVAVSGAVWGDIFVFFMYLLGIVVAIVASIIMKIFSKNYEVPPFIMELPAYHAPQFRNLMAHLWEKFKHFIYKASTIITASIVLIWFLSSYGWAFWEGMVEIEDSMLADVGRIFAYFFYPLGWSQGADGWKFSVASVTGLIAKEDVVTTMAQLGLCDEAGETILFNMTNSKIFAFATYNLFTFPCFAAIATAKSESSKKAFPVTLLFWFFGSYVISLIVYLVGLLFEVHLLLGLLVLAIIGCSIVLTGYLVSKRNQKKILA